MTERKYLQCLSNFCHRGCLRCFHGRGTLGRWSSGVICQISHFQSRFQIACFLGFERCLCFILPLKSTKFWNKVVFIFALIFAAIFMAIFIHFQLLKGWPSEAATICRSFSCMLKDSAQGQSYLILRYTTVTPSNKRVISGPPLSFFPFHPEVPFLVLTLL